MPAEPPSPHLLPSPPAVDRVVLTELECSCDRVVHSSLDEVQVFSFFDEAESFFANVAGTTESLTLFTPELLLIPVCQLAAQYQFKALDSWKLYPVELSGSSIELVEAELVALNCHIREPKVQSLRYDDLDGAIIPTEALHSLGDAKLPARIRTHGATFHELERKRVSAMTIVALRSRIGELHAGRNLLPSKVRPAPEICVSKPELMSLPAAIDSLEVHSKSEALLNSRVRQHKATEIVKKKTRSQHRAISTSRRTWNDFKLLGAPSISTCEISLLEKAGKEAPTVTGGKKRQRKASSVERKDAGRKRRTKTKSDAKAVSDEASPTVDYGDMDSVQS